MELKDLVNVSGIVGRLLGEKWRANVRYKLDTYADLANKDLERFNKIRLELYEKYGDKEPVIDENGAKVLDKQGEVQTQYKLRAEEVENFNKELQELVEEECNLKFNPLTLDDFGDFEFEQFEIKALIAAGLVKDPMEE